MTKQKRHPIYMIFLFIMLLLFLTGVLLIIAGSKPHPALPLLWQTPRLIARWMIHG